MRFQLSQRRLSHLLVQRNFLIGLSGILLVSNVFLATLSFMRQERIIISPPDVKQQYWVEGETFSPSYLEEMGLYAAHLLLDVTESSILTQGQVLLRWVTPSTYGDFKTKLLEDEKRLKKEQATLHFKPGEVEVFPESLTVHITGSLMTYVSAKKVSDVRETYRIRFSNYHGNLLIETFDLITSEGEKDNEH